MNPHVNTSHDRSSQLSRRELVALGKTIVRDRRESLGCDVKTPSSMIDGRLEVRTPSGRSIEVSVSTQRVRKLQRTRPSPGYPVLEEDARW